MWDSTLIECRGRVKQKIKEEEPDVPDREIEVISWTLTKSEPFILANLAQF